MVFEMMVFSVSHNCQHKLLISGNLKILRVFIESKIWIFLVGDCWFFEIYYIILTQQIFYCCSF